MPEDEWQALIKQTLKKLRWKGRWFAISAASHAGCDEIVEAARQWLEARDTTATAPVASADIELTPAQAKRKRARPNLESNEPMPNTDLRRTTTRSTTTQLQQDQTRPAHR